MTVVSSDREDRRGKRQVTQLNRARTYAAYALAVQRFAIALGVALVCGAVGNLLHHLANPNPFR
jgi:hypothetical protein